jgi:hypothetical protein
MTFEIANPGCSGNRKISFNVRYLVNVMLTLSSRAVEYLIKDSLKTGPKAVAYFYFQSGKGPETRTAEVVLASLLKQLASQLPVFPANLEAIYEEWATVGKQLSINKPTRDQLANIFTTCCRSKDFPVYVLLESFHECAEDQRKILTPYLLNFVDADIRLYVTARPHISLTLRESLAPRQPLELRIIANDADISRYVKKELGIEYTDVYGMVETAIKSKSNGR